ncbi:hypothetical protein KAJ27_04670 [bacterium]|nr:hypothetical protein [bacterium]
MKNKARQSSWLLSLIALLSSLIAGISIYVMEQNSSKIDEALLAVDVERLAYEMILSEKNTLINRNNLTKVNELHARADKDMESISNLLDYIDENFQDNIKVKSEVAKRATLQYKKFYGNAVHIIKELQEIKLFLEEQGEITILEIGDYVQDKFGSYKTNKDFRILQRLNTAMRIQAYATQIRLNQKEYIQTHKEKTIHIIKVNFDSMLKDMQILRDMADNEFEQIKTKRFMEAAIRYQNSSNRWLAMQQKLNDLLLEMEGLFDQVTEQARDASEESAFQMNSQNSMVRSIILVMLCLMFGLLFYTSRVLRRKNDQKI